jgi:hypothetical protein
VSGAARETEAMQENIQDWFEPDERLWISASDRGRNCCHDIFYLFSSVLPIFLNFPFFFVS